MRPKIAALTGMLVIAMAANAAQAAPDFAPASNVGWIAYGTEFIAPPTGPGPVKPDPQNPFVPDPIEYDPAAALSAGPDQSTFRVADLSNPILQPWAREELRKQNERVLSGAPGYTRQVACWPLGVPAFLLYPVQPVFFIQASKEITMVWQSYNIPRRIYLDVPHAASVILPGSADRSAITFATRCRRHDRRHRQRVLSDYRRRIATSFMLSSAFA